jgi:predicted metal-dependent HD superfamily phosphohydrolase
VDTRGTTLLLRDWETTCAEAGLKPAPELAEQLLARYDEPHRAYHTVDHLAQVLRDVARIDSDPLLRLAAWFHDAVYEPGSPDNETASAALARAELNALGVDPESTEFVADAILATADHRATDRRFAPLLDADMAILGAPSGVYKAYVEAIRQEYSRVPAELFTAGRRAFVLELLERPQIFVTDVGRARFEAPARGNLRAELAELES